jgi:methionyl aminopeptidase
MDLETLERTGPNYSVQKLLTARRRTTEAVLRIAEKIRPGMLEEDARRTGQETLEQLGSTSGWHRTLVRFGTNTVKNYVDPSEPNIRLGDNDIFFVDIGPIWTIRKATAAEPSWLARVWTLTCGAARSTSSASSRRCESSGWLVR